MSTNFESMNVAGIEKKLTWRKDQELLYIIFIFVNVSQVPLQLLYASFAIHAVVFFWACIRFRNKHVCTIATSMALELYVGDFKFCISTKKIS